MKIRHSSFLGRRRFLGCAASLAASLLFGQIPSFLASNRPVEEQDFVILNGWVLTREDMATSKATSDVV
jgi:hypothetical protein